MYKQISLKFKNGLEFDWILGYFENKRQNSISCSQHNFICMDYVHVWKPFLWELVWFYLCLLWNHQNENFFLKYYHFVMVYLKEMKKFS